MAAPGVELLVAARADAVVPALVIGLGGIWTEALDDVAVVPLPASAERIERALRSLRGAALLTGGRGGVEVDLAAVADAASRAGALLLDQDLELLELNPLIAGPEGCVAVDALALSGGASSFLTTCQVATAGLSSTLPAASFARTSRVCFPRFALMITGFGHGPKPKSSSSLHS